MSIQINTHVQALKSHTFAVGVKKKCVSQENREPDKIQLSPPVTPGVLNTYFLPIRYSDAIIPNIVTFLDKITSKCA